MPAIATGSPLTSVPGIYIDHRAGGRLIGEHLIGLGHRRIVRASTAGSPASPTMASGSTAPRACGAALRAAGLELDPDRRGPRPATAIPPTVSEAMTELLDRPGHYRRRSSATPTSWPSVPSPSSAAVGIHCPTDISIAGFDDHPMAQYWGLTTVSQHAFSSRACGPPTPWSTRWRHEEPAHRPVDDLTVELVVRETTAPALIS